MTDAATLPRRPGKAAPDSTPDKAKSQRRFPAVTGVLNQDAADVEALGIRQTPTFFLGGNRLENFGAESLIADVRLAAEIS